MTVHSRVGTTDELIRRIIDLVAVHGHPQALIDKQWAGDWSNSHVIDEINQCLFLLEAEPYEDCCERCAEETNV